MGAEFLGWRDGDTQTTELLKRDQEQPVMFLVLNFFFQDKPSGFETF